MVKNMMNGKIMVKFEVYCVVVLPRPGQECVFKI